MVDGKIADNQTIQSVSFRVKSPIISKLIPALLSVIFAMVFLPQSCLLSEVTEDPSTENKQTCYCVINVSIQWRI